MSDQYSKLPRLFLDQPLSEKAPLSLEEGHAHYFRSVLRRQAGDSFRTFNGQDGEWLAEITELGKKRGTATCTQQIKPQSPAPQELHLLFAPIKKHRMDFLIEKAVELGVTDLHPVLTHHTETRKINKERIESQIIEAVEQCERMHKPTLHNLENLDTKIATWQGIEPIYAALERQDAPALKDITNPQAFLIGPEGGFDKEEIAFLSTNNKIRPISLGQNIYRAETACLLCIARSQNN